MFSQIRRTISRVLDLAARLVEAVEGILGRFAALIDAINGFEPPATPEAPALDDLRIVALEASVRDLTTAVEDGVLRVQRSENRVRAIVQSARRQLAEHGFEDPGVEAEAAQLSLLDGERGEESEVPEVPEVVEDPGDRPSSIPGVTVGQIHRAYTRP